MNRPDITKAQAAAAVLVGVPLIANLLRAFGVYDMNDQEQHSLTEALTWAVPFAAALVLGDAHLRGKRNEADAVTYAAAPPSMGAPIGSIPPEALVDAGDPDDGVVAESRAAASELGLEHGPGDA
jgi:hypothetical protein